MFARRGCKGHTNLPGDGPYDVQSPGKFSPYQQLADFSVIQLRVHFGQHTDAHPVLSLRVDGTTERATCYPQVFVHLL